MTLVRSLESLDQQLILKNYRKWLLYMANTMTSGEENIQDLAQEGWIAMWRALQIYNPTLGALPPWLTYAARTRMSECVRRKSYTGMPARYGRLKGTATEIPVSSFEVDVAATTEDIELAYHHGEVVAAINSLSPEQREYVYRRFWQDEPPQKLNRELRNRWVGSKPKLQLRLQHLRETETNDAERRRATSGYTPATKGG